MIDIEAAERLNGVRVPEVRSCSCSRGCEFAIRTGPAGQGDTGPDDSVHSMDGIFIFCDPLTSCRWRTAEGISLLDMAPTVLELMGVLPGEMEGRPIAAVHEAAPRLSVTRAPG